MGQPNYATYPGDVTVASARLQVMKENLIMSAHSPLRVASIVLPMSPNTLKAHVQLQRNLLNHWGGYTQTPVTGAWRDETTGKVYSDVSEKYEVAMDTTTTNRDTLRIIARVAGEEAGQLAVFFVHADGEAVILEIDEPEGNTTNGTI